MKLNVLKSRRDIKINHDSHVSFKLRAHVMHCLTKVRSSLLALDLKWFFYCDFRGFYFVIDFLVLNNKYEKTKDNERRERVECSVVEAITYKKGNEAMNFINSFAAAISVKWINEQTERENDFSVTKTKPTKLKTKTWINECKENKIMNRLILTLNITMHIWWVKYVHMLKY